MLVLVQILILMLVLVLVPMLMLMLVLIILLILVLMPKPNPNANVNAQASANTNDNNNTNANAGANHKRYYKWCLAPPSPTLGAVASPAATPADSNSSSNNINCDLSEECLLLRRHTSTSTPQPTSDVSNDEVLLRDKHTWPDNSTLGSANAQRVSWRAINPV